MFEILEETPRYEAAWARDAKGRVSKDSHGAKDVEKEKLLFVNNMCENYSWGRYTEYERCPTIFKECTNAAHKITRGRHNGQLIWDAMRERFKSDVDATKLQCKDYKSWFKLVADALRILKYDAPDAVVEVAILGLPRLGVAKGDISILPDGIPVVTSDLTNDKNIRELIADKTDSQLVDDMNQERKQEIVGEQSEGPARRATSRSRRGRGRAGSSALGPNVAVSSEITTEDSKLFWLVIQKKKRDLLKISPQDTDIAQIFEMAVVYQVLTYKKKESPSFFLYVSTW